MSNMVKRRGLRGARAALAALLWTLGGQTSPTLDRAPFLRAVSFALPALALGGVLLWSTPADAQTATVLVKNTGQPSSGSQTLDTSRAQEFTTGANPAGYTLSSIGFDFASITATSTAGAHLKMTLNADSSGNPGTALCTLTDPATFSGSGVQTFDAPTTDPCPTLEASTPYFAVIERVASSTMATITLSRTGNSGEDTDGEMGWTIGNTLRTFTSGAWGTTPAQSHRVVVRGNANNNPPEFTDTAPTTRSVDENTTSATNIGAAVAATDPESDTLVYGLTGTDASSFSIDSTSGQLKTSASLDFETNSSYSVNVTVHDGKDAGGGDDTTVDATIAVTISVNNEDEAGTVTLPATFTGGTAATASVTDPDGTVSSPSWRWARGDTATGSFSNISGATSASYTPIAADVGKYLRATVTYTDPEGSGKTASAVSSSTVGGSNAEPTFDDGASTTRTLPENSGTGTNVGGVVAATDGDSDTLTYSMTGSNRFNIDTSTGQIKTASGQSWNYEGTRNFQVTVNVRDSKDAAGNADTDDDDTITVAISLTNVNEAPEITNLLTASSAPENSSGSILLMASDVDVPDTQTWSVESTDDGDKFQVAGGFLPRLSFKDQPDFETPTDVGDTAMNNTYVVTVKLTDGGGLSDTLKFTVTVTDVNEAPVFTSPPATADFAENGTGTVADFDATDVDASSTLTFSLNPDDDGGKFDIDSTTGALTFKNPPNFEMPTDVGDTARNNTYAVEVKVTDAGGLSDTHTLIVTVTDVNEAPEITTTVTAVDRTENLVGATTLAASDVDASTTLSWSVESDDDGSKFQISPSTGVSVILNFKAPPDFETPTDVGDTAMNNTYVVKVKVTDDGGLTDEHTVTVTVTNVNEPPVFTSPPPTADFAENGTGTVADFDATDVDALTTLTFSLSSDDDGGKFDIDPSTGVLTFKNPPDFEMPTDGFDTAMNNTYVMYVEVRDNGSPRQEENHLLIVTVTDVNEAPVITTTATTASVAENTTAVHTFAASDVDASTTLRWSVEPDDDGGKFDIDSTTGALSFKNAPDFETPTDVGSTVMNNTYVVTVKVTDDGSPTNLSDTHTVTVTVDNVNEAPEITTISTTYTDFNVDENTATSDVIKTYVATDVDASTTLTWSLEGNDAGDFTITKNADGHGELQFRNAPNFEMPVDADTMNDYDIRVKVEDNGIPGNRGNQLDDTVSVEVNVLDVNEAPVIRGASLPSFAEIEYDATSPDLTVATYTYTDEDRNPADTITWRLSGADATHFNIGSSSGVLSFSIRPDFENPVNADSDNEYVIEVQADDGQGGVGTTPVVVTVTNVDETPEITTTADEPYRSFVRGDRVRRHDRGGPGGRRLRRARRGGPDHFVVKDGHGRR